MDLVAQIDKLRAQTVYGSGRGDFFEEGRVHGLRQARTLVEAHARAQVDLVARLVVENTAQYKQIEEARQILACAQGLAHPGHRSLRELAEGLVDELARADGHGKD
jgi:hypothetical protein